MSAPFDQIIILDAETRWNSKDYTLKKMTTEEYIRDPRFKAFGFCFKEYGSGRKAMWVPHAALKSYLAKIDWSRTAIVAHNALFDYSILSWVYGVKAAFVFDTMSMARALRGPEEKNGLAVLAEERGLPAKGKAVHSTDGLLELTPEIEVELADYCAHDTFLCEELFKEFIEGFPKKELELIDMTIRMYTEPKLVLDEDMLAKALETETDALESLLAKLGVKIENLSSNDKFAELLRALNVEPPTKKSPSTGKDIYAFAKSDALFQALIENGEEDVQLLCEARLKAKSTQLRTRAQRFLDIAKRGRFPIPLAYWGAHTGRWQASRGQQINVQNMKRGSFLKRAIMAPPGYTCVVGDLSQIEVRCLAAMSNNQPVIEIFKSGEDPYAMFGRGMFGIPDLTKDTHPALRQSAKSALLGAGYNLGWVSFAAQVLTGFLGAPPTRYNVKFAKQLGLTQYDAIKFQESTYNTEKMETIPRTCSWEELVVHCLCAKTIIDRYREASPAVTAYWDTCHQAIEESLLGGYEQQIGALLFKKGEIVLPSGMALKYKNLRKEFDHKNKPSYFYNTKTTLYGGKIVENACQAIARCVISDAMLRINKRYPVVLTVHDEVVCVVPEKEGAEAMDFIKKNLIKSPKYLPGVPLDAEVSYSKRYGDCK